MALRTSLAWTFPSYKLYFVTAGMPLFKKYEVLRRIYADNGSQNLCSLTSLRLGPCKRVHMRQQTGTVLTRLRVSLGRARDRRLAYCTLLLRSRLEGSVSVPAVWRLPKKSRLRWHRAQLPCCRPGPAHPSGAERRAAHYDWKVASWVQPKQIVQAWFPGSLWCSLLESATCLWEGGLTARTTSARVCATSRFGLWRVSSRRRWLIRGRPPTRTYSR